MKLEDALDLCEDALDAVSQRRPEYVFNVYGEEQDRCWKITAQYSKGSDIWSVAYQVCPDSSVELAKSYAEVAASSLEQAITGNEPVPNAQ